MSYNKKVLDHYENPRNVGKMDPDDKKVGTGMVGAPACFAGNTKVILGEGENISLKEFFESGDIKEVWSYNIKEQEYQLKPAKATTTGEKELHEIIIEGSPIWVTYDHKFLLGSNEYLECSSINKTTTVKSFYRSMDTDGNWVRSGSKDKDVIKGIYFTGESKTETTYTLQVEENNNYIVLSETAKVCDSGIVVKNCGDVMRLQIEVSNEGIIEGAVFKTYGCGSAIASSSLITEWVQGKTLEEASEIKNSDIAEELSLPPVKIHCSVLGADAISAAIKDYKSKQD